jgi:peroxiredoxin
MNQKKEEHCLLCESSKEALEKLNSKQDIVNEQKPKTFWKGLIILGLIGAGVFSIVIFPNFPSQAPKNNKLAEVTVFQDADEKSKPQIGALSPDFVTEDILGNKVILSDFRGKKPVLLVFWATWCGYCAKELPDLKTFTSRYQDRIQILAVDSGEPKEILKDYFGKNNINFQMLLDEQRKIWNQYLVRGTPSHFLIGKDGRIITMRPGLASLADLEIMLSMILEE